MADEMFTMDCREQFAILTKHRKQEPVLAGLLEGMCNTLAMGMEEYLRAFDAKAGMDLLADLGNTTIKSDGDAATLCLRCLSLVLEHVPRSIELSATVGGIVPLVRSKITNMHGFTYGQYSASALVEDALRVVNFLCEGDTAGALATSGLLADITKAMDLMDSASIGRCLAAIAAILAKITFPSPGAAPASPPPAPKKGAKSAPATTAQALPHDRALALRHELQTMVVPRITALLTTACGRGVDAVLGDGDGAANDRDSWPLIERGIECLSGLLYRLAVAAHPRQPDGQSCVVSPWIAPLANALVKDELAGAVACPENATNLLATLVRHANTERRQLTVLAALTDFAHFRRDCLRLSMLEREVVEFFTELLAPTKRDFGNALANCFPKRTSTLATGGSSPAGGVNSGASGTSSNVICAAAAFLEALELPLPNSERRVHFRAVPVHLWEWADDMHAFSEYSDDACTALEVARAAMHPNIAIKVRSTQYRVDLDVMKQVNVGSGVGRPIRRQPFAKMFVFVDWSAKTALMSGQPAAPIDDVSRAADPNSEARREATLMLLPVYGPLVMNFAASATNEVMRSLAVGAVVRLFTAAALPVPTAAFYRCLEALADDIGSFLASILSGADDLVTIDEVFAMMKMLFAVAAQDATMEVVSPLYQPHPDRDVVGSFTVSHFARACRRFGVVRKLQSLIARLSAKFGSDSKPTGSSKQQDSASSAAAGAAAMLSRAADLESLCNARSRDESTPRGGSSNPEGLVATDSFVLDAAPAAAVGSPTSAAGPVAAFAEAFRACESDAARDALLPELVAALSTATTTTHEFTNMHLTTTLARYLCGTSESGLAPEWDVRRRVAAFAKEMHKHASAATFLVKMLVNELALASKRFPEVQGIGPRNTSADRCRPWPEALQRLAASATYVDICSNKDFNTNARAQMDAGSPGTDDPSQRCPAGHTLRRHALRSWSCDVCTKGFEGVPSMGCRACNFDVCQGCQSRGYAGGARGASSGDRMPGVRAHLLATVGDIEAHFRRPLAERYPSAGNRLTDVLQQMDALQSMLGLAGSSERAPGGLADVMRAMLQAGRSNGGDAEADPLQPPVDTLPPLNNAARREMHYAGLGRVPYQESLFSCLYRKAMGLGIGGAIATFEDAIMFPPKPEDQGDAAALGTPVRSTPQRPTKAAADESTPPDPASQAFNSQRTYYFHVLDTRAPSSGLCCCGEMEIGKSASPVASPPGTPERPSPGADATARDSPLSASALLTSESPTSLALRAPELEGTARFVLLRLLHAICVGAASPGWDHDSVPRIARPLLSAEVFTCHDLGARAIKAASACAIRVAVMPPQFALPGWLVEVLHLAPFLLAANVRYQLLLFLSVNARRSLAEAVGSQGMFANPIGTVDIPPAEWTALTGIPNRPPPKEVVRRGAPFAGDAIKALLLTAERRAPLMFDFAGDTGTGQGPTQQFYTMVAENLCAGARGLWWSDIPGTDGAAPLLLQAPPAGFHPRPRESTVLDAAGLAAQKNAFYLAGAASGRALIDGRLLPLPLSAAAWSYVRRKQGLHHQRRSRARTGGLAFRVSDVEGADPSLAHSLRVVAALRDRIAAGDDAKAALEIESLELTFVVPGCEDVALVPDGQNVLVTAANVGQYVSLLTAAVLESAVSAQLDAFAQGFADVVPPDALLAVDASDLGSLIAGSGCEPGKSLWTKEDLFKCLKGDHGYSKESKELGWLREVLCEFTPEHQRAFLFFCTGCPRLPLGGLSALGTITVVRKDGAPDSVAGRLGLPSVNTCFKYLKLPPYGTRDALRANLLTAILNAGDGFDLS